MSLWLGLVSPVRAATYQTFVLSNEGGNGLVSRLVAAGYGSLNQYQALSQIAADANPSVEGIITPTFLQALAIQPIASPIFTTHLSAVNVTGQAIAISTDGTVQTVNIFGASYQSAVGVSLLASNISGVGSAKFLYPTASGGSITSFTANGNTYNVIGIAFGGEQAFILSNEGGGLISRLMAGGYGNLNIYQALQEIVGDANPNTSGILTGPFMNTLRNDPLSSPIFATKISNVSGIIAISTDGTVQAVNINGSAYQGTPGSATLVSSIAGVGSGTFVYSTRIGTRSRPSPRAAPPTTSSALGTRPEARRSPLPLWELWV